MLRGCICRLALAAGMVMVALGIAAAAELPRPTGPVVLRVGGLIDNTNDGAEAVFDEAMLKALGLGTIRTSTAWTDGVRAFEGVPFDRLLAAVGARGTLAHMEALNAFMIDIPVGEIVEFEGLLALSMDGQRLSLRDRGPLWLVFPRDKYPQLVSSSQNFRWIWQLSRIDIR